METKYAWLYHGKRFTPIRIAKGIKKSRRNKGIDNQNHVGNIIFAMMKKMLNAYI